MTALPLPPQRLPLTAADYVALGEDPDGVRYELLEGNLVMSPSPVPEHQIAELGLARQLEGRVPDGWRLVPEVDVDRQLVSPPRPGTVRAPDLVVVTQRGLTRRQGEGGVLRASEVLVAIEIISPASKRMDYVIKHSEYADAGIPHYRIVDLGEPDDRPQLTAHHLAGAFGYATAGPVVGTFTATEPFAVSLDLDALV